jgi:hypothetical protein
MTVPSTAPTFGGLGAASVGTTDASGLTVPYAPGVTLGAKLLVALFGDDGPTGQVNWVAASGWSAVVSTAGGAFSRYRLSAFEKIADASDVAASLAGSSTPAFTITGSAGGGVGVSIGQMAVAPYGTTTEATGVTGLSSGTSVSPASITSSADNSLAVFIAAWQSTSDIDAVAGNSGGTWAKEPAVTTGFDYSLAWQHAPLASAGTISGGSAALSSTLLNWGISFAVKGCNLLAVDFVSPLTTISGVADIGVAPS